MSGKVLLSVVIPSYNAEKTICAAIESVDKHGTKNDVEIIIINDGSTDNTEKKCTEYISSHKTEHVVYKLVNQPNAGHGSAVNYGIKHAKGEYLRILDADDYFDAKKFGEYLNFLAECEDDLVCSDYKEINRNNEKVFHWHDDGKSFKEKLYEEVIEETSPYLLPCVAIKTEALRQLGKWVDEKCYYDDQEYDLLVIAASRTVSYYNKAIYCYVVGNNSQSISLKSLAKNVRDHRKVVEWLVRQYYAMKLPLEKDRYVFDRILIPMCHRQYDIAVNLCGSRQEFMLFDRFLKQYKELYCFPKIAGERLKIHRLTRGLLIKRKV